MTNLTANEAFIQVYKGSKNFMTPNIIKRFSEGLYHIEISSGTGFNNDPIYGITVLSIKDLSKQFNLSQCLHSMQEVNKYINTLNS